MKMYRQIWVSPDQRPLQRIFWRTNSEDELACFQLNTVTYGTSSAPYLAIKCLMHLSEEFQNVFPRASAVLANDFYADDLLTGGSTVDEVLQLQKELITILQSAGFELRKYLSNSVVVLKQIQVDNNHHVEHSVLTLGPQESIRTLGLIWNSSSDTIQYNIPVNTDIRATKRSVLSSISQIFDPLGLLAPVIVKAKFIMQDLWQLKIAWDDPVPSNLCSVWHRFKAELESLNKLQIPRFILQSNTVVTEFHEFSDASEKAYGACVFVRTINQSGHISTALLCAKSRVAPLKKITLPRLELLGALLLSHLFEKIRNSLTFIFDKTYFWCDSTIVLYWIKSEAHKWKTFISNRISQIQRLTNVNDWYHVKSAENPADLITRGLAPDKLVSSSLWWRGPSWLSESNSSWTSSSFEVNDNLEMSELKKTRTISLAIHEISDIFLRFSSLLKLQRVLAYCLRWKHNVFNVDCKRTGSISPEELEVSLTCLIKLAQHQSFQFELTALKNKLPLHRKSILLSLNPFLDATGLIRVGGRLEKSHYEYDKKHPLLLSKSHPLTKLIMIQEHKRLLHCGPSQLLASIRNKFWPMSGRSIAKKVVHDCIKCFKANPPKLTQLMGDLPSGRVDIISPFTEVGVDYAGPFHLKDRKTRNAKLIKCYVCLFICFTTKAIHLELVSDLTTQNFISCLKRFIARRGKPTFINSDNGTNFVGAQSELQNLFKFLQNDSTQKEIIDFLSTEGITWKFIPPRSPNFGGLWEAGIKSTKYHLKRILGNAALDFEEFYTVLIQIEAVLNSRPLSPLSSNPLDLTPLTPAHFLIGKPLTQLPEPNLLEINENRLTRYQRLQQLIQHYWSRWSREYISELQTRLKWKTRHPEICHEGSMVVIREDNLPPLCWKMGRVTQLHRGEDDVVRVVTVKVASGIVKRPLSKICVLPID